LDWAEAEELATFEVEPKPLLVELEAPEDDESGDALAPEVLVAATVALASTRWTTTPPVRSVAASRAPAVACRALLRAEWRGITGSFRRGCLVMTTIGVAAVPSLC
jgi:hypothetical protein